MKKITILFLLSIPYIATYSQEVLKKETHKQDSKFAIGIQITPTFTSIEGNTKPCSKNLDPELNASSLKYDIQCSYSAGLSIEYFVNKYFSFKSGLAYEKKVKKTHYYFIDDAFDYNWPVDNFEGKLNFHYLTMPLLASFSTKGKIRFYMESGIFLGYLLLENDVYDEYYNQPYQIIDNTDKMNKFDFGISLGMGLRIPVNHKFMIDFGLCKNRGIVNINDSYHSIGNIFATNSTGFQFGLKYLL